MSSSQAKLNFIPGPGGVIIGPSGEYFKKNEKGELVKYTPSDEELVKLKGKINL